VEHLRPVAVRFAAVIGVLIASAVCDLGPRAGAAFQSMAVPAAAGGLDAGAPEDSSKPPPAAARDRLPAPGLHLPGDAAGTTPSGSGPSAGPHSDAGVLPRAGLPANTPVSYFREPAGPLDLPAFDHATHGPPRRS
jgi:hypothetical protein